MVITGSATSTHAVVATVGRISGAIIRHDLGNGTAVSYLFDGDEACRHTCQWRVKAGSEAELAATVKDLLASLTARGVAFDTPRFSGTECNFADCGPWL